MRRSAFTLLLVALLSASAQATSAAAVTSATPTAAESATSPAETERETVVTTSSGQGFPWGLLGLLGLMGLARRRPQASLPAPTTAAPDMWQLGGTPAPVSAAATTSPLQPATSDKGTAQTTVYAAAPTEPAVALHGYDQEQDPYIEEVGEVQEWGTSDPAWYAEDDGYLQHTPVHNHGAAASEISDRLNLADEGSDWEDPYAPTPTTGQRLSPAYTESHPNKSLEKPSERLAARQAGSGPDLSKPPRHR